MTPLAMEMLIWFYSRAEAAGPFDNIRLQPQQEIVAWFLRDGIIEPYATADTFRTTERGTEWLMAALSTPYPSTWHVVDGFPMSNIEPDIAEVVYKGRGQLYREDFGH